MPPRSSTCPGTSDRVPERQTPALCAGLGEWLNAMLALRELGVQSSGQRLPLLGRWGLGCGHGHPGGPTARPHGAPAVQGHSRSWGFSLHFKGRRQTADGPAALRGTSSKEPAAKAGHARDEGSIPGSGRSPGGGRGSPLQHSCLENPTDRRAWRATVHGVGKSRTRLKRLRVGPWG